MYTQNYASYYSVGKKTISADSFQFFQSFKIGGDKKWNKQRIIKRDVRNLGYIFAPTGRVYIVQNLLIVQIFLDAIFFNYNAT